MCFKKEKVYKCYKGQDMAECCQQKVEEAVKHRTYVFLLIISVALLIMALTIKTVSDDVFVDQVSFASTLTSIILSVIAIWMSITGERSANEIRNKVSSSVDELKETTEASQNLTADLRETLNNQNEAYDKLNQKLEAILEDLGAVKGTVSNFGDLLSGIGAESMMGTQENEASSKKEYDVGMIENVLKDFEGTKHINTAFSLMDMLHERARVTIREAVDYAKKQGDAEFAYLLVGFVHVFSKCGLVRSGAYKKLYEKYGITKES